MSVGQVLVETGKLDGAYLQRLGVFVRRLRVDRPTRDIDACHFMASGLRDKRCRHEITLDRITYRCARFALDGVHDGIHDANLKHSDGGLCRW